MGPNCLNLSITYSRISSGMKNPQTAPGSKRLRTCDDSLRAVHDAAAGRKLEKVAGRRREDVGS